MSFENCEDLTKDQYDILIKYERSFLKTGTKSYWGKGQDTDYVLTQNRFNELMTESVKLKRKECKIYKYEKTDFIIVNNNDYWKWEMATYTACALIRQDENFNIWFRNKDNRKAYFSTFLYRGTNELKE